MTGNKLDKPSRSRKIKELIQSPLKPSDSLKEFKHNPRYVIHEMGFLSERMKHLKDKFGRDVSEKDLVTIWKTLFDELKDFGIAVVPTKFLVREDTTGTRNLYAVSKKIYREGSNEAAKNLIQVISFKNTEEKNVFLKALEEHYVAIAAYFAQKLKSNDAFLLSDVEHDEQYVWTGKEIYLVDVGLAAHPPLKPFVLELFKELVDNFTLQEKKFKTEFTKVRAHIRVALKENFFHYKTTETYRAIIKKMMNGI